MGRKGKHLEPEFHQWHVNEVFKGGYRELDKFFISPPVLTTLYFNYYLVGCSPDFKYMANITLESIKAGILKFHPCQEQLQRADGQLVIPYDKISTSHLSYEYEKYIGQILEVQVTLLMFS